MRGWQCSTPEENQKFAQLVCSKLGLSHENPVPSTQVTLENVQSAIIAAAGQVEHDTLSQRERAKLCRPPALKAAELLARTLPDGAPRKEARRQERDHGESGLHCDLVGDELQRWHDRSPLEKAQVVSGVEASGEGRGWVRRRRGRAVQPGSSRSSAAGPAAPIRSPRRSTRE